MSHDWSNVILMMDNDTSADLAFILSLRNALPWKLKAHALMKSAELLLVDSQRRLQQLPGPQWELAKEEWFHRTPNIARMLMAYSLECLAKPVILQDPAVMAKIVEQRSIRGSGISNHVLVELLGKAGVQSDRPEFIKRWSTCALWVGRYPFPVDVGKYSDFLPASMARGMRVESGDVMVHEILNSAPLDEMGEEWKHFMGIFEDLYSKCPDVIEEETLDKAIEALM